MKLPLIIEEHGDLLVFRDVQKACLYLEAEDVANDMYSAFDSLGNVVELGIERADRQSRIVGTTTIDNVVIRGLTGANLAEELSKKIVNYLNTVGVYSVNTDMPLENLVDTLDAYLNE